MMRSDDPDLARPGPAGPVKPRVLVVEDHEIHRKVILRLLEQFGRECVAVDDAEAAIRALDGGEFGLVLMPPDSVGGGGALLSREIRLREAGRDRPRVPPLTLVGVGGDRREAGIDGHLGRPVTRQALRDMLSAIEETGRPRRPLDRPALMDRCGGDAGFVAELLASFAETVTCTLGILRDSLDAGEMARAAEAAHGLKGCARTVAAEPLADSCGDLEAAAMSGDTAGSRAALARVSADWSDLLPALGLKPERPRCES